MYVPFVSDEHFKQCVRHVLLTFNNALDMKISIERAIARGDVFDSLLFSNVVDPFKMAFEIKKIGGREWVKKEILRQLDKSVEQRMGEFHQKLLGGVKGWKDLGVGNDVDLMKTNGSVYIELKNKFNTCSSDALTAMRHKLEEITRNNHQTLAYWGFIIANTHEKSGETVWVKKKFNRIETVKKVWGEKVYEVVTGLPDALQQVYQALPQVIADVSEEGDMPDTSAIINEIIMLLEPHLENIQKQIYNQVFRMDQMKLPWG
jgi:hypothetical protein